MNDVRPTLFPTFNARFLDAERVGATFVMSPFFRDIVAPVHTAIIGPRGSGKTTLLKMLSLPAIHEWKHAFRDEVAASLDYLAVYIPTTISWNANFRTFYAFDPIPDSADDLISLSLFRHGVLLCLLQTWFEASSAEIGADRALKRFHLAISDGEEPKLVRDLAQRWGLPIETSTVNGIRSAISKRTRELQSLSVRASFRTIEASRLVEQYPYIVDNFLDDTADFANFLSDRYGFHAKLALCFDELEIAHKTIVSAIINSTRSLDQRLLIKYSTAPYVGRREDDNTLATQGNDFSLVYLSSFSSKDVRAFTEDLFLALCRKHSAPADTSTVLGPSLTDIDDSDDHAQPTARRGRYSSEGGYANKFRALQKKDNSFAQYASAREIDFDNLQAGSENTRAAVIRKILWPVIIREEYLFSAEHPSKSRGHSRRIRSVREVSDIYTGYGALSAICEGNPRWIIGMLEPMVIEYVATGKRVKTSLQKELIAKSISSYFALLSTVPNENTTYGIRTLVDLIERIGMRFQSNLLGERFEPDPVLSFTIDAETAEATRDLVGRGINIGAFVTAHDVKGVDPYRVGGLSGLKVRLSNMFAPHFRLPLTGGRTIRLSTILEQSDKRPANTMADLFGKKI